MAQESPRDGLGDSTAAADVASGVALAAPAAGNRYLLLEPIGRGGSAVVYTAYDRQLDRKIAIKLLREAGTPATQARMLREAQALARLKHPNVVTVHDTGTFHGQVFIAMELVEGASLRAWLGEKPREWRAVLRMFVAAGRGLAAAHAKGLVHRDFKPDNVLIGRDGAVRVADFGLARLLGEQVRDEDAPPSEPLPLEVELTRTGAVVGTPRYMAPEQHTGAPLDARADQFAFCVALYEGLYRQTPFSGDDAAEKRASVVAGRLARPPRSPRRPARLFAILKRGLARDPEARFPTMDALLHELERVPAVVRRRTAAALVIAATAAASALVLTRSPDGDPCGGAAARLAGAWDTPVSAAVRGAFLATGRPHAGDTYARAARKLDAYAGEWTAMRREACEATVVRHEQSDALFDLRMACLERRRSALASLTSVLGQRPEPAVLDRAVIAVDGLAPVAGCADREALTAAMPPPAASLAPHVLSLRARLDGVRALLLAGQARAALPLAEAAASEARGVVYPPVVAEALAVLVQAQMSVRDYAAARRTAVEALLAAGRARDDLATAHLWINLLIAGNEGASPAEALTLLPAAEATVARAGDDPLLRALLLNAEGAVHRTRADYAAAERTQVDALRALDEAARPDQSLRARVESDLGRALMNQSRLDEARQAYQRAIAISEELLGPSHPSVASYTHNLGNLEARLGRPEEARRCYLRALAIWERVDPEGVDVALEEHTLGRVALSQELHDEARRRFERTLAIRERLLGRDHPRVATVLSDLGDVLSRVGRHDEALAHAGRALAIRRKAFGDDHIEIAHSLGDLAVVHLQRGALREALASIDDALRRGEPVLGADDTVIAAFLTIRADVQAGRGRHDLAATDDARALAIREKRAVGGLDLGTSLAHLGERKLALGETSSAVTLLERAVPILESSGAGPTTLGRARVALARSKMVAGAHDARSR